MEKQGGDMGFGLTRRRFLAASSGVLVAALAGCGPEQSNKFAIDTLTSTPAPEDISVGERWLRAILTSMQGETGQYLITAAQAHGVKVAYADNLEHRLGEFSSRSNTATLELPLGIETATPQQFAEMVLTGRRIMYEELDHAVRHHERTRTNNLSAQSSVDGYDTATEAIARITAYIGMSQDAAVGSAPDLVTQLGVRTDGHATYFATTDREMADTILAGLTDGIAFHENPDLINSTFSAFYGTDTSEFYVLYYASALISDRAIEQYQTNVSLARILDDYRQGNDLSFDEFSRYANLITNRDEDLLETLRPEFENGRFTSEAERVTLNDLVRFKRRMSRPDGGRADQIARVNVSGSFFRDASPQRIFEEFSVLVNNAQVIQNFMASCMSSASIPTEVQEFAQDDHAFLSEYLPLLTRAVANVGSVLNAADIGVADRIKLERLFRRMEEPLVIPSRNRVTIYDGYIRGTRHDGVRLCLP